MSFDLRTSELVRPDVIAPCELGGEERGRLCRPRRGLAILSLAGTITWMPSAPASAALRVRSPPPRRSPRVSRGAVRYLAFEALKVFLFVMLVLELGYSLLVAVAVARNFDLDLPLVLPVMGFTAVSMLGDSVPLALLFATSLAYGRLIADREVMALRSFGLSTGQLLLPAVLLGAVAAGAGYLTNGYLVPNMKYERRNVGALLVRQLRSLGEGTNRDFRFANLNLWIRRHDGRHLAGIFLSSRGDREGDEILPREKVDDLDLPIYPWCLYAERGRILFPDELESQGERASGPAPPPGGAGLEARDGESAASDTRITIELEDVSCFWSSAFHSGGESSFMQSGTIDSWRFSFDPAGKHRRAPYLPKELPNHRLLGALDEARESARAPAVSEADAEHWETRIAKLLTEYHGRWAGVLACFLFPVLGGLIALFINSPNRLVPFFTSAVLVPVIYYSLATAGRLLGHSDFPPVLSMHMASAVLWGLAATGYVLLEKKVLR